MSEIIGKCDFEMDETSKLLQDIVDLSIKYNFEVSNPNKNIEIWVEHLILGKKY